MYDSDLFLSSQKTIENSLGFRQLFKALPPKTEIAVNLDGRIPCALTFHDPVTHLEPRTANAESDFEITLFPESIRRLSEKSPDDLFTLVSEISRLVLAGHARIRLQTSIPDLYKKGYVESLKSLAPEVQNELSKLSFVLISQAHQAVEKVKRLLSR
jgi:hypothetical protein